MTDADVAGALPPGVHKKMVILAARALSAMPPEQIPPALRRAAAFAPARRAKLAGPQLAAALEADDEFRQRLAVHVRAMVPQLIRALDEGTPLPPARALETAAAAYLVRPSGWESVVQSARDVELSRGGGADEDETVQRLTAALSAARSEAKGVRERLRGQLDDVKADNAQLRRTLGEVRQQLRGAQAAALSADQSEQDARREALTGARAAEAENRRWRSRVAELEGQLAVTRRAGRDARDTETMRLRLLLDTVVDAAAGLRRELALAPSDLSPADTVSAVEPASAALTDKVGHGLSNDDPVLLRRLLELPRVHLIVDGYNVSKSAWPSSPLDQQRARLTSRIAALVAPKRVETTVVFDGAELLDRPSVTAPRGIRVRFSPAGVIADDLIRELVSSEPLGRPVVVVSSDRELAESVAERGARPVTSSALIGVLGH